jgi:hypothetical protein
VHRLPVLELHGCVRSVRLLGLHLPHVQPQRVPVCVLQRQLRELCVLELHVPHVQARGLSVQTVVASTVSSKESARCRSATVLARASSWVTRTSAQSRSSTCSIRHRTVCS